MTERQEKEIVEQLTSLWVAASEARRFREALLIGMAIQLLSFGKSGETETAAWTAIRGAIDKLMPEEDTRQQCSFCGRSPPEVRLAAGPNAFICEPCVKALSETFSQRTNE
jgi:hypothetical protein